MRWRYLPLFCLALGGCANLGPNVLETEQADYADALLAAEKRQLLVNILRLRNGDVPSVVHVEQIVAGFERRFLGVISNDLSTELDLTGDWNFRGEGSFTDRPTITLRPLQGSDYARAFFRPVDPINLVGLLFGGGRPETLLGLTVERINGERNDLLPGYSAADTDFGRIVQRLAELRNEGLITLQFEESDGRERFYLAFDQALAPDDPRADELRDLLKLDPTASRYEIVPQGAQLDGQTIVVLTRPLIEILADVAEAVVLLGPEDELATVEGGALTMKLRHGPLPVAAPGAFVVGRYRNQTYWIGQDDDASKRLFSMVILLSRLTERRDDGPTPVLTIPVN